MSNKRKNRKSSRASKGGILSRAFNQTKLAANVTEEQDWYLDTPDVRLTRIFAVVLILHVVAVGGILAFKMIDKASEDNGVQLAAASKAPDAAIEQQSALAGQVPPKQSEATPAEGVQDQIAAPLRKDTSSKNQYRVLAGDTLSEIAKSLGVDPVALRAKNAIQSDRELYPGRWLDIPEKGDEAVKRKNPVALPKPVTRDSSAQKTPPVGNSSTQVYKVQSGDTVWALSRKFSVSYQELISANSIENPQNLRIGQQLNIPTAK